MNVCMVNGGAGHVTPTTFNYSHIIQLFVGKIGMLDFQLEPKDFEEIAVRNEHIVKELLKKTDNVEPHSRTKKS
jgi:hypothetical protein